MKKYITIAALLAAGSACANAAYTDNLAAYWSFDNGSSSYVSYTDFSGSITTGLTEDNFQENGGFGDTGYIKSHRTDGNMDFYNGLGGMSVSASAFTIAFKVQAATADYRSLISFTIGDFGQVNLQTENPSNGSDTCLYINGGQIELAEDSAREAIRGSDGWANVVIYGNGTTLTLNINGYSASVAYTPGDNTNLSNLQLGSQWGDGDRRVDASFDDFAIWSRTLSETEIADLATGKVFANGTVVPEPLAFGMLAGLGALAIVASRRRRR